MERAHVWVGRPEPFSTAPLPILNIAPPIPMPFPVTQLWCALCMTSDATSPSHLPLTPPTLFRQMDLGQLGCTPSHKHTPHHTSPHSPLVQLLQFRQMPLGPLGSQLPSGHTRHNNACERGRKGGVGHVKGQRDGRLSNDPHPQSRTQSNGISWQTYLRNLAPSPTLNPTQWNLSPVP